jgi:iron complex outermembrane recepter protein
MRNSKTLLVSTILASGLLLSNAALAQDSQADNPPEDTREIIVTGVFGAKAIEDAPIAITAVTSEEIAQ